MIYKLLKNTDSIKRWNKIKANKRIVIAFWGLVFCLFISITAELWSNNKPIVMSYKNKIYFPVFVRYVPSQLNLQSHLYVVDYKKLNFSKTDWALWPLVKWSPFESNIIVEHYPSPPSKDNWLGTDDRGRDVLSRLIYGFRYSIGFALLLWFCSYTIGVFLGSIMGFMGGKIDLIGQRCVEVIEALPTILLLITLVDLVGSSFFMLVGFMIFFSWINISYYIRAEFLKFRKRDFVSICHVQGMHPLRIMIKHILPNSLTPILSFAPFSIANGVAVLAMLDYLGFGLIPPTPSWGELLAQSEKHFTIAWWLALFPSLALFSTLMMLMFIGDGIRNVFNSRSSS